MNEPFIRIIIVTHQSADTVARCLDQLAGLHGVTVTVVDNASKDDSIEIAERSGARVIRSETNLGYGAACNLGAKNADESFLCFLNPDCILTREALDLARASLTSSSDACFVPDYEQPDGLCRGKQPGYTRRKLLADVLLTNGFGEAWLRRLMKSKNYHDAEWHWPLGTCLFITRSLFDRVGGFDDRFFLYMEDVEFGGVLHRAGGRVESLPCVLHHTCRGSSKVDAVERRRLLNEARMLYGRIHYGRLFSTLMRAILFIGKKAGR